MYTPKPIDTSKVELPRELLELIEIIARQVHDTWASERIAEGWVYGEVKNSEKKTTPCLVDYSELPEIEKEYDRRTAIEALKMAVLSGYRIEKIEK